MLYYRHFSLLDEKEIGCCLVIRAVQQYLMHSYCPFHKKSTHLYYIKLRKIIVSCAGFVSLSLKLKYLKCLKLKDLLINVMTAV
jgi:hypothetical protein